MSTQKTLWFNINSNHDKIHELITEFSIANFNVDFVGNHHPDGSMVQNIANNELKVFSFITVNASDLSNKMYTDLLSAYGFKEWFQYINEPDRNIYWTFKPSTIKTINHYINKDYNESIDSGVWLLHIWPHTKQLDCNVSSFESDMARYGLVIKFAGEISSTMGKNSRTDLFFFVNSSCIDEYSNYFRGFHGIQTWDYFKATNNVSRMYDDINLGIIKNFKKP